MAAAAASRRARGSTLGENGRPLRPAVTGPQAVPEAARHGRASGSPLPPPPRAAAASAAAGPGRSATRVPRVPRIRRAQDRTIGYRGRDKPSSRAGASAGGAGREQGRREEEDEDEEDGGAGAARSGGARDEQVQCGVATGLAGGAASAEPLPVDKFARICVTEFTALTTQDAVLNH